MNVLAPNEALVAVGVEIHIVEAVGMRNVALPSIEIKMMRQKFEQQWSVRKTQASEAEQYRLLGMLREASLNRPHLHLGLGVSSDLGEDRPCFFDLTALGKPARAFRHEKHP